MDEQKLLSSALKRYRRFGYTLNIVMIVVGIVGWIIWKWYAIVISILIGLIIGQIYSMVSYKNLSKKTGYETKTIRRKLMEIDDQQKRNMR